MYISPELSTCAAIKAHMSAGEQDYRARYEEIARGVAKEVAWKVQDG